MIAKESLKNHWWFRTLKVIYIFLIGTSLVGMVAIAISERPILDEYSSTYQIRCDKDGILRGNIKGSDLYHFGNNPSFIDDNGTQVARFFCTNPDLDRDQTNSAFAQARIDGTIPTSDNFLILIKKPTYNGSWLFALLYLILGILIVSVIGWIIKIIFMYIVVGENPKIPFKEKIWAIKMNLLKKKSSE